jgi:hypothetical protein
MRLGWVHYSIGSQSGVEMVMRRFASGLLDCLEGLSIHFVGRAGRFMEDWVAQDPKRVSYVDVPEMSLGTWARTPESGVESLIEKLVLLLQAELKGCDVVIVENASVGAHPAFNVAIQRLLAGDALKKTRFCFRVHDLAFSRPANLAAIQEMSAYSGLSVNQLLLPDRPGTDHLVVNRTDAFMLFALGLNQEHIHYLPNPVDISLAGGQELAGELRQAMEKRGWAKPGEHLLIYPVRGVPRKNITEALLLTRFLNLTASGLGGIPHALQPDGPYRLMIAIRPQDCSGSGYADQLCEFVESTGFEARIGLDELVGPDCRVTASDQDQRRYGVAELYATGAAAISTSVMEGFGFGFLEPWCAGLVAVGRRLPVMDDFVRVGMRMDHFYRRLVVEDRDFPELFEPEPSVFVPVSNDYDSAAVKKRLDFIQGLDAGHNLGHFVTANRWAIDKMLEALVRPRRLVEHNRERVFDSFSIKGLAPKLAALLSGGTGND